MKHKIIKTWSGIHGILRITLGSYLKWYLNVTSNGQALKLKPPYLILGNHTNLWDPFLLGSCIKEPVHYVASDEYFRNPLLRFLLNWLGTIPKTKFMSDIEAIKYILQVKNHKGIISIFPEGQRNWDGKTGEIIYSTAKLIKLLKIPVVTVLFHGAYLSRPRWAKASRRGPIFLNFEELLNSHDINSLSVEEVYKKISSSLFINEIENQRKLMVPYEGRYLAKGMELFIYVCPHCKSIASLKSKDNSFFCRHCGYSVVYNKYGFIEGTSEIPYFDNPSDWNKWQLDYMKGKVIEYKSRNISDDLLIDDKVMLFTSRKLQPLKKVALGSIHLSTDSFYFESPGKGRTDFDINKITGINVQRNNRFEFYYNNLLYRFHFKIPLISAYKWVSTIEVIKNL